MRGLLAALVVTVCTTTTWAGDSTDPLRLVPRQADLALRIEPRRLVESILSIEAVQSFLKFPAVQEGLDSTNGRRFQALIAYYEKQLGHPWPELLDRLGGGGIIVATKFTGDAKPPALVVVQSRDAELLPSRSCARPRRHRSGTRRKDSPDKPKTEPYREIPVTQIGEVQYAVAGSALLIANKTEAMKLALDLFLDGPKESLLTQGGPAQADQMLPPNPLARLWVNLVPAHESMQGKQAFKQPKTDLAQLILFGGLIDVIGKSPFLAAGLYRTEQGLTASVPHAGGTQCHAGRVWPASCPGGTAEQSAATRTGQRAIQHQLLSRSRRHLVAA